MADSVGPSPYPSIASLNKAPGESCIDDRDPVRIHHPFVYHTHWLFLTWWRYHRKGGKGAQSDDSVDPLIDEEYASDDIRISCHVYAPYRNTVVGILITCVVVVVSDSLVIESTFPYEGFPATTILLSHSSFFYTDTSFKHFDDVNWVHDHDHHLSSLLLLAPPKKPLERNTLHYHIVFVRKRSWVGTQVLFVCGTFGVRRCCWVTT